MDYDYEFNENFNGDKTNAPKNPMFRVTHFPQLGAPHFTVYLHDLAEAVRLDQLFGLYDAFQYNHNIKPDYANMTIIGQFDEDDQEWYDLDENDINDILLEGQ